MAYGRCLAADVSMTLKAEDVVMAATMALDAAQRDRQNGITKLMKERVAWSGTWWFARPIKTVEEALALTEAGYFTSSSFGYEDFNYRAAKSHRADDIKDLLAARDLARFYPELTTTGHMLEMLRPFLVQLPAGPQP